VSYRVSKTKFAELVERALAELPPQFAKFLEEVPLEVTDWPSQPQLADAKVKSNHLLLGLYRGRPRTERGIEDSGALPDSIFVFQEPIQRVVSSEAELIRQVRITVLHEIGHHFGLTEEDLERLGYS
jgi:predicted Zn-dependent protease with MMP-like domain